ncbi:MAG: rRNA maturation RNase YbeY [Bacillales bacterium]|jgi:probable rRNA maturation factor|nr:rRNA maturation RNase YbeY [Bacillales bacterium]
MMALTIDFLDEKGLLTESVITNLDSLLKFAANKLDFNSDAEVSVSFVDNNEIQELNKQYRNKDYATDVLSFPLEDDIDEIAAITGPEVAIGDIIISVEKAKEQAEEYNHSLERELGFLIIHGFLHLIGYDHETDDDEKTMFNLQKEILEEYGLHRN